MKNNIEEMQEFADEELAIAQSELGLGLGLQWVQHRFSFPEQVKANSKDEKALVLKLAPLLRSRGLEFEVINGLWVEAWEDARLSKQWSDPVVEAMCRIADQSGFEYEGWTWEAEGKPTYFRRILDGAKVVAFGLVFLVALQFTFDGHWSWLIGGSPLKVAMRIAASMLGLAAVSIFLSAIFDWKDRRKYR